MRTTRHYNEREVFFAIADLDPDLHKAADDLAYTEVNGEWVDSYPRNTPYIDRIFQTFSQAIGPMLRQTAGLQQILWESALDDFLRIVAGEDLDWWLGGSAALAVRGLPIEPRDFDIITDDAGARRLADLLLPALVQPLQANPNVFSAWFGRAFLNARFEWVGGVNERADQPEPSDFGPAAAARLEVVAWNGHLIRVPPLDLQLAVSRRRGLAERVAMIEGIMDRG